MAELAVGDIIKGITDDVKLLVRDEVELAKSELVPTAKKAGMGAGLFGAAGFFAISGVGILYFAAVYGLVALGLERVARVLDRGRRPAAHRRDCRRDRLCDRPKGEGPGANDRAGQSDRRRGQVGRAARAGRRERARDRGRGRQSAGAPLS